MPLAVVLRQGGISVGGVIVFIVADLLIVPILNICRKYDEARTAAFILGTFYAAIVAAAYFVEFVFGALGIIPDRSSARIPDIGVSWDFTTWLDIAFQLPAAAFLVLPAHGRAPDVPRHGRRPDRLNGPRGRRPGADGCSGRIGDTMDTRTRAARRSPGTTTAAEAPWTPGRRGPLRGSSPAPAGS